MAKDKFDDVFGELTDVDLTQDEYKDFVKGREQARREKARQDTKNNVPKMPPPSPEILEKRKEYVEDFIKLHLEVFPDSTGIRPFGKQQQKSIQFGRDIFAESGRLLKLEPRGYAKTTRLANEAIASILLGMQDYIVIICSNQEKAEEILESIKTELYNNEQLLDLFPETVTCIRAINDSSFLAKYQTYDGIRSYIFWGQKTIRFPYIPGEPSSGRFIEIRPMNNVKGLHKKLKSGPDAGKIVRPTLYLFDDPQTHDDARSPTTVNNIINRIKRDALRGGSHTKRASAIMAITPVCSGDVAYHFEMNEHSWDLIRYKMVEKFPDKHEWWMDEYAKTYLNYDRRLRGDRTRAALEAMQLVKDNYDKVHKGSEVTWEHAYCWDEEPQTECSALQHAYNIILDDGQENFEYECQCSTEYGHTDQGETLHATAEQIRAKTNGYRRNILPQRTASVVAHIDVGKHFLAYTVVSSPNPLQPHVIDYGTFPKQPTPLFSKRNLITKLSDLYPTCGDYRDMIYLAVKDLIELLATRVFHREDGAEVSIDAIGVDAHYEEAYVSRAIKESPYRSIVYPTIGLFVGPDDQTLTESPKKTALRTFENCYVAPNRAHTLDFLYVDVNYFKTEVHRGWNLIDGTQNSISIYGREFEGEPINQDRHITFSEHFNTEEATRAIGKKTGRSRVIWEAKGTFIDNEFFDNVVACYALFYAEGLSVQLDVTASTLDKEDKKMDMSAFMQRQRK